MMTQNPYAAVMPVTPRPGLSFVRGEGSWVYDEHGRAYLDAIQGWAVNCLGHSPPVLSAAIAAQAGRLLNVGPVFYSAPMLYLAQLIVSHSAMDEVFFTSSGAEANEGAIKLARKWGQLHRNGAYKLITTVNSFHGRTLATMAASGKPQFAPLFEPKVPGFTRVPYNDLAALAAEVDGQTVGVMLELVQGEAGVIPAQADYVHGLRRLCDEQGLLLIIDEVQTGVGRLGELFAHQLYGIEPDIMTLGKGLGGGVPLGALACKRRFSCFAPGEQGGTFSGNALSCAAGAAVLEVVSRPAFLAEVRRKGAWLRDRLVELSRRHGLGEVRGAGLLLALDTGARPAADIVARALPAGLLLNAPRPDALRLMPALNISDADLAELLQRLQAVL